MTEPSSGPTIPPIPPVPGPPAAPLPPPQRDPEFASVTATILEARDLAPAHIAPELYLRVLANPFLGFAGLVAWLLAVRWAIGLLRENPELIGPISPILVALFLAALALVPGLFHVHCLDCGTTLRMSRWRWHTCATSALRRVSGRPRWLRGPMPPAQVVLWLWLLLSLAVALPRLGLDWQDWSW